MLTCFIKLGPDDHLISRQIVSNILHKTLFYFELRSYKIFPSKHSPPFFKETYGCPEAQVNTKELLSCTSAGRSGSRWQPTGEMQSYSPTGYAPILGINFPLGPPQYIRIAPVGLFVNTVHANYYMAKMITASTSLSAWMRIH